jgi:aldehyde:ferredoxin oxidoreductase
MFEIANPMAGNAEDVEGIGRAQIISAITGMDFTAKDLDEVADRVYNLERAFLGRVGMTKKDDMPPWKAFNVPVTRGPLAGAVASEDVYKELLDNYYKHMNWDLETGLPTRAKLEQLDLDYVADELEKESPYPAWEGPILWPLKKYPHGGIRACQ